MTVSRSYLPGVSASCSILLQEDIRGSWLLKKGIIKHERKSCNFFYSRIKPFFNVFFFLGEILCGFCRDFSVYPYWHCTALQLGACFLPLNRSREVILYHFASLKIPILKMNSFSLYFISLAFSGHDIFIPGVLFFSEIVIIYCFCCMFGVSVVFSVSRHD